MRYILFILLTTLNLLSSVCQQHSIQFRRLDVKDGLSQLSVNDIFQDSEGYMWIGTLNGLNKYDGYTFTHYYHTNDPNSLSNNNILCITEDNHGYIWVGTNNGINRMDKTSGKIKRYLCYADTAPMGSNIINCMLIDKNGVLWLGCKHGILYNYDRKTDRFNQYFLESFRPSITGIYDHPLKKDTLLLVTYGGLFLFDKNNTSGKHYRYTDENPLLYLPMSASFLDENSLWIGTRGRSVYVFDIKNKTLSQKLIELTKNAMGSNLILSIQKLHNELWIGSYGGGLVRYNLLSNSYITYTKDPSDLYSISDNVVNCIYKSSGDILWFGTDMGGLNMYASNLGENKFSKYFRNTVVNCMYDDGNNTMLIGTRYNGLIKYNRTNDSYIVFTSDNSGLWANSISCILESSQKNMFWIGSENYGLGTYNIQTNHFTFIPNIFSKTTTIHSLHEDKDKNVWIGTSNGLDIYNYATKKVHNFAIRKNISGRFFSNSISCITEDNQGHIWVGTRDAGIGKCIFSNNTLHWINYKHNTTDTNSLSYNEVLSIHADSEGFIWIGTIGYGLNRYNPATNKFKKYTTRQGLANDIIMSIEEDNHRNLWISTAQGISKLNIPTGEITNYDIKDGLQDYSFSIGASFKNKKGELFFGGPNGLNTFYPDSLRMYYNKNIPPVVITRFTILKDTSLLPVHLRNITHTHQIIELSYRHNDFCIEFAAMDFSNPPKNRYAYKLENYDKEWLHTTAANRIARYTNMPYGDYTFTVLGSNCDNVWNEKGASLRIRIKPPFYLKPWFLSLIIALFIAALFLSFSTIIRHFRRMVYITHLTTQETLFNKENQLRTLIDNLPDFIYIKDKDSKFILANDKLAKVMIGKQGKVDDLIGKCDHDFYEKDLADQFLQDEKNIMTSGKPLIGHIEPGFDENHNPIIVSTTKVPITNLSGNIIGLVGIGRDVTAITEAERKIREQSENLQEINTLLEERSEEILIQKEEIETQKNELEQLNKTKDKLFSIIGHDLRNPLHAIGSLASLLTEKLGTLSDEERKDVAEMIRNTADNTYELLENLLNWARAQSKQLSVHLESFDISVVITDTIELLTLNSEKKKIQIHSMVPKNTFVYADKNMINTIIRNLVNNAIKFTGENGTITIKAQQENNYQIISVTDTGMGMDQQTIHSLFVMTEKKSTYGTAGEKGTGLGLIICKEFITTNNGEITVESEVGKGTTFFVKIPASA